MNVTTTKIRTQNPGRLTVVPNSTRFEGRSTVTTLKRTVLPTGRDQPSVPAVVFGLTIAGLLLVFAVVILCLILYFRKRLHKHPVDGHVYSPGVQTAMPNTSTPGNSHVPRNPPAHYIPMDGTGEVTPNSNEVLGSPEYIEIFDPAKHAKRTGFFSWMRSLSKQGGKPLVYVNVKGEEKAAGSKQKYSTTDDSNDDIYYCNAPVKRRDLAEGLEEKETQELYENT